MKVEDKILRNSDRDIIKVEIREDYVQPFYRSTGKNSGMGGKWLPFDGLIAYEEQVLWFDKRRFVGPRNAERTPLHRFGTTELKNISDELGKMNLSEGTETKATEINAWLNYPK